MTMFLLTRTLVISEDDMKIKRNKRAQFFGIYLVLLTLLMCGTVIMVYRQQSDNARSELVSPKVVLDIADGLELFEMREVELIKGSFNGVNFGEDGFEEEFREKFLAGFKTDDEMKEFVLDRLTVDGRAEGFFENVLYPDRLMSVSGDKLMVGRAKVGKTDVFKTSGKAKNYFPVDFVFEFERSYIVSAVGGEIKVEVVE